MKKISFFILACLMIASSCSYDPEQLFDRDRAPIAPVLAIEGATTFEIPEDLPDFFNSALTWSRANFGKGVSATYTLRVSNNELFTGNVKTVDVGVDVYMRALTTTELYDWAVNDYGVYNAETDETEPATLYFRIEAKAATQSQPLYSNVESIMSKWADWRPVELDIYFKVVSGNWAEGYAVYAWSPDFSHDDLFGPWPGLLLNPVSNDGWHHFVVPKNRPINLIINNQGNGRQFDFLQNPTKSAAYEFAIGAGNNNCDWTEVEIPVIVPPSLYMIGEQFGGWDWSSSAVVEMTPVHSHPGHFWCVRYMLADKKFKWFPGRNWDNGFNSLGENIGFELDGGDAKVTASGMYMVYVDMENGKISVEPAKVYGIGNCFGGWGAGDYPFTVENETMVYTTTGSGELRMYAMSNIAPGSVQWWQMEFIILNGLIEYRGTGNDQERVNVDAGKKITLDFNAGTGTIQ